jgi:hypothetical protein
MSKIEIWLPEKLTDEDIAFIVGNLFVFNVKVKTVFINIGKKKSFITRESLERQASAWDGMIDQKFLLKLSEVSHLKFYQN